MSWCRTCMAEAKHAWYLRNTNHQKRQVRLNWERTSRANRDAVWNYLADHPCVDCGESDPVVLQFDHVRTKRKNIAQMMSAGFSWAAIIEEIANCEVRCGNCHRRKTAREQGIYDAKHSYMKVVEPREPSGLLDNQV